MANLSILEMLGMGTGGLAGGFAQGAKLQSEMKARSESLKIAKQKADAEEKLHNAQMEELKAKATERILKALEGNKPKPLHPLVEQYLQRGLGEGQTGGGNPELPSLIQGGASTLQNEALGQAATQRPSAPALEVTGVGANGNPILGRPRPVPQPPAPPPAPVRFDQLGKPPYGYEWVQTPDAKGQMQWHLIRSVKKDTGPEKPIAQMEFEAEQKAIPYDTTKEPDRIQYAQRAGEAGLMKPAEVLNQTKPPAEKPKVDTPQVEQFTPAAIESLAQRFVMTGELPGMGMGRAATEARVKVLNRVGEIISSSGNSPGDQVAKQASYRALRNELSKVQSLRGPVEAFAKTAKMNLELAEKLSDAVERSDIPALNRYLIPYKIEIRGDADAAGLNAAIRVAINEAARVTNNPTGAGILSDTARKEVEDILRIANNPAQIRTVVGILKQDIDNRRKGYDQEIAVIEGNLRKLGEIPGVGKDNAPPANVDDKRKEVRGKYGY